MEEVIFSLPTGIDCVSDHAWFASAEVIQEIGYDCVADIWSLGITSLEMAEGKAPYGEIHPMRAIFMIPTKPPPSFQEPDKWSSQVVHT